MAESDTKFERRPEPFAERLSSRLWKEIPAPDNPYLTQRCLCHGYDLLQLMERRDFVDVLYLLIRGELPNADQRGFLGQLMVGLCSPGPRHPATRAVMNAGWARQSRPISCRSGCPSSGENTWVGRRSRRPCAFCAPGSGAIPAR